MISLCQVQTLIISYINKLLEKANVYPAHRVLFRSYLQNEVPQRLDEIVFDELQYEITQMRKSICKILKTISRVRPLIIAISDLHFADFNTLELIKSTNNILAKSKTMFLYCYNKNYFFQDGTQYENWSSFTSLAEEQYSIMDLGKGDPVKENCWQSSQSAPT